MTDTVRDRLQELKGIISGSSLVDHSGLLVPVAGQVYATGTLLPLLSTQYSQHASGLLVPESLNTPPQPLDLFAVYLTPEEVFGTLPSLREAIATLQAYCVTSVLRGCADLLSKIQAPGADLVGVNQECAATLPEPYKTRAHNLVSTGRPLIAPQAVFKTMSLALKHSSPDWNPLELNPVLLVLTVQGHFSYKTIPPQAATIPGMHPHSDPRLISEIISNQDFNKSFDEAFLMATFQRRWRELPYQLADDPRYADLAAQFSTNSGTTVDDLATVGLALWTHAWKSGPIVSKNWLASLGWTADRIQNAVRHITATPEQLQENLTEQEQRFGPEWSFDPFRRHPLTRLDAQRLLVLSPALLLERVLGWPLRFDLTNFKYESTGDERRAVGFLRHICEVQVLESLKEIVGPGELTKRLWDGDEIKAAYGNRVRLADAAIDYGDAWMVVEISTRQLRRPVVLGGDLQGLHWDLELGVLKKAEQIHSTIEQLKMDENKLTGYRRIEERRFYPILVIPEGFPLNPSTSTAIAEMLKAAHLLQASDVAPLCVLDMEDLYVMEACVHQGTGNMLHYLSSYSRGSLRHMPFSTWLLTERRESYSRPPRLQALMDRFLDLPLAQIRETSNKQATD